MMSSNDYFSKFVKTVSRKGVFFDTEILLVLVLGIYDQKFMRTFSRTSSYELDDFQNFVGIFNSAKRRFVSPQVLAELTNYTDKIYEPVKTRFYDSMKKFLDKQIEQYIPKNKIMAESSWFIKTGFTDTSVLKTCIQKDCALVTTDATLTSIAQHANIPVFNYRNFQGQKWF